MFSKAFYKILGQRVGLMKIGGGSYYSWDKEKGLVPANFYLKFTMVVGLYGGIFFVLLQMTQMYLKSHKNEIPEEGGDNENQQMNLKEFATVMIQGAEILLVICLCFLNYIFLKRIDIFQFLFNELISYNKFLTGLIKEEKLTLTKQQRLSIAGSEMLNLFVMFISMVIPFGVMASLFAKIEPTNQIVREWLEIELSFNLKVAPFMLPLLSAAYGVGSTVSLMAIVISIYYTTTTICTESFTPVSVASKRIPHCNVETDGFGILSDAEVVHYYRTQQIFNGLLNEFFKSVLIAFHHVGCLATAVVLLVFMIKYDAVIGEHGPVGYLIVFSCLCCPIILIYFQAKMGGAVVERSEDFKTASRDIVPRKFMLRKFSMCCTIFYIEVAFPFYKIHKETFTMFGEQIQDYSMELLLW